MSLKAAIYSRAGSKCELCGSSENIEVYEVPPIAGEGKTRSEDRCILLCSTCLPQVNGVSSLTPKHWHCLNDSMWSEYSVVQVVAWRVLDALAEQGEGWASDAKEQLYFDEDIQRWAEHMKGQDKLVPTFDSNGAELQAGDSVTLIKDLVVKGANFTAKRGTMVRNISLTANPLHIEGRVNGTRIVLVTEYLKKVVE